MKKVTKGTYSKLLKEILSGRKLFLLTLFGFFFKSSHCQVYDSGYAGIHMESQANRLKIQTLDSSVADLKLQLRLANQGGFEKLINAVYFLDASISVYNNLQILFFKESYRNKITSLNNPTSNELGFNLLSEIQIALKPLLEKCRHTDENKFIGVLGSIVNTGSKGMSGLFNTTSLFGSILNMVGNLTVTEKKISRDDLDNFIKIIGRFFNEYEKLNRSNFTFSVEVDKLKIKLKYLGDDIKSVLADVVMESDKLQDRNLLKKMASEDIMLRYFNADKLKQKIDQSPVSARLDIPPDIIKSCKEICVGLQRLYEEYSFLYNNNYKEIKSIITETKSASATIDQDQLNRTLKEIDALYAESREADNNSLHFKTLSSRLDFLTMH